MVEETALQKKMREFKALKDSLGASKCQIMTVEEVKEKAPIVEGKYRLIEIFAGAEFNGMPEVDQKLVSFTSEELDELFSKAMFFENMLGRKIKPPYIRR
jgi:hypothetical protein